MASATSGCSGPHTIGRAKWSPRLRQPIVRGSRTPRRRQPQTHWGYGLVGMRGEMCTTSRQGGPIGKGPAARVAMADRRGPPRRPSGRPIRRRRRTSAPRRHGQAGPQAIGLRSEYVNHGCDRAVRFAGSRSGIRVILSTRCSGLAPVLSAVGHRLRAGSSGLQRMTTQHVRRPGIAPNIRGSAP
jgi:hypothetical protein